MAPATLYWRLILKNPKELGVITDFFDSPESVADIANALNRLPSFKEFTERDAFNTLKRLAIALQSIKSRAAQRGS